MLRETLEAPIGEFAEQRTVLTASWTLGEEVDGSRDETKQNVLDQVELQNSHKILVMIDSLVGRLIM